MILPLAVVSAPLAAMARAVRVARRGNALGIRLARRRIGHLAVLDCELDLPISRAVQSLRVLSGVIAEGAARVAANVGRIGLPAGEDHVLAVFVPRPASLAEAVFGTLVPGGAHRYPHLWVALRPGSFLSSVIPADGAVEDTPSGISELLGGDTASVILRSKVTAHPACLLVALSLYGPVRPVRSLFSVARQALATLPPWERIRTDRPAMPSTAVKSRLQR